MESDASGYNGMGQKSTKRNWMRSDGMWWDGRRKFNEIGWGRFSWDERYRWNGMISMERVATGSDRTNRTEWNRID